MKAAIKKIITPYYHLLIAAAFFLLAIYFAYKNYFIQDDAYIAFVYAKNFAHGHGLVWYPGSDEYGYTSFLYTFIVGCFMVFGLDPEWISAALNFSAYIIALVLTYLLTFTLSASRLAAICAALALATHHTFSAYASGGLETMVVTAFILGFYTVLCTAHATQRALPVIPLAILASSALLARLDSALLLFPGYVWMAIRHCEELYTTKQSSHDRFSILDCFASLAMTRSLWIAAGIPTLAVGGLLLWAYSYYGYALPNTFYAKMPGDESMAWLGKRYLRIYLSLHYYIPAYLAAASLAMLGYRCLIQKKWRECAPLFCLIAVIALWLSYVIYIGGDFMEFRVLVPVLALFCIVLFASMKNLETPVKMAVYAMLLGCLLCANYLHMQRSQQNIGIIASTRFLGSYATRADSNWRLIGQALYTLFPPGSDVTLGVFPSGMIPYYSELRSIDVYGLNYRRLYSDVSLQNPHRRLNIPGHKILGNDVLVEQEKVNINIYHPQPLCKNNAGRYVRADKGWSYFPFTRHRTILMPINERCYLVGDYVTPHPLIEERIAAGTILDYSSHKDRFNCPAWLCK